MARTASSLALGGVVLAIMAWVIAGAGLGEIFVAGALVSYGAAAAIIATRARATAYLSFHAADGVTLVRLGIACLFAGYAATLAQGFTPTIPFANAALGLGIATLVLDGVDGWLARRTATESAFGARFDMEVDAFLILVLAVIACANGKAGAWVLLSGAARYLYVTASVVCSALTRPLFASRRRKTVAVIQGAALVALLAPAIAPPVSDLLAAAALALLLYSFAADIRWQLALPHAARLSPVRE